MMKILYLLIFVILFTLIIPVYGQFLFTVYTDKPEYSLGDTITIGGNIGSNFNEDPLTIQIMKNTSSIHLVQLYLEGDGSFSETIIAEGESWEEEQEYIVRVSYIGQEVETTFYLTSTPVPEPIEEVPEETGPPNESGPVEGEPQPIEEPGGGPDLIPLTANIDKNQYEYGETLQLTGNIGSSEISGIVVIAIYKDGELILPLLETIQPDGSFQGIAELYEVAPLTGIPWVEGQYEINVVYWEETVVLEFSISPVFTLETDKSSYHQLEPIILNGTIHGITANIGDDVDINVLDEEGNELILQETVYFTTSTSFNHTITPDDPAWRWYNGVITIQADYRNYSTTTQIDYSDFPVELSLEFIHIENLEQNSRLDEHKGIMTDYESMIYDQQEIIDELIITQNTLLSTIEMLTGIVEGLIEMPVEMLSNTSN